MIIHMFPVWAYITVHPEMFTHSLISSTFQKEKLKWGQGFTLH